MATYAAATSPQAAAASSIRGVTRRLPARTPTASRTWGSISPRRQRRVWGARFARSASRAVQLRAAQLWRAGPCPQVREPRPPARPDEARALRVLNEEASPLELPDVGIRLTDHGFERASSRPTLADRLSKLRPQLTPESQTSEQITRALKRTGRVAGPVGPSGGAHRVARVQWSQGGAQGAAGSATGRPTAAATSRTRSMSSENAWRVSD